MKKEDIMKNSLNLFIENGYENTSVKMILERCSISKGALYHYFENKEVIMNETIDYLIENDMKDTRHILDGELSYVQKLKKLLKVSIYKSKTRLSMEMNSIFYYNSVKKSREVTVEFVSNLIEEGIDAKEFKNIDSVIASKFIYENMNLVINEINDENENEIIDLFFGIISTILGVKIKN